MTNARPPITVKAMKLVFDVPWSALCSDNRKYLSGKFILTTEYRQSKTAIGLLSKVAAKKAKWERAEGPLRMVVCVTEPDHRKRDLNWQKCCNDGITEGEGVWWDDSQVRDARWHFSSTVDKSKAGATITIEEL